MIVMMSWTTLLALMALYVTSLTLTTLIAQPFRHKLVALVDDMLDEPGWTKDERESLTFTAEGALSSTVGLLLPFAAVYGLACAVLRGATKAEPRMARLDRDPRHGKLCWLFVASIAGGSPFAALLSLPFVALAWIVLALRGDRHPTRAFEAPLRQVSGTFAHC